MKIRFVLAGAALLLTGCVTQPENEVISSSGPEGQQARLAACIVRMENAHFRFKEEMARMMRVSVEAAPVTLCTRVRQAVESGRISNADRLALSQNQLSPGLVRILQGREAPDRSIAARNSEPRTPKKGETRWEAISAD
ncbi:hypothetical protein [Mangrovicella endophytica]|uniref:hypothetical protein n=1 Tax=Mangrovicella endophytica TaxID=2066697 RepID=UPI000C9E4C81|nr:hypothetical protein [Mangrovicella endophytica]